MPNYKNSTLPCTTYVRAKRMTADNPNNGGKFIQFQEEVVLILPDGTVTTSPSGECSEVMTADNANESFEILDTNGESVGKTMTYQEIYQLLSSLYYHVAMKRDNLLVS